MKTALLPGSYDPITVGHMDVILRANMLFDRVIVSVMNNDARKYGAALSDKHYLFSMEERVMLARAACAQLPGVEVMGGDGLLIDLFDAVGADVILKGVRNETDFTYEQKHAHWNRTHNQRAETLYLPADERYESVSSTMVKERLLAGQSPEGLVPQGAAGMILDILERRNIGGSEK